MRRLFKRKLQRLAEGRGPACLSVLLDGWPARRADELGGISLGQIMPCITAPEVEAEEEEEEEEEKEKEEKEQEDEEDEEEGGRGG